MMYKLINGELVEPPVVWKGVAGYNKNYERLMADGWKPKIVVGTGTSVVYIDHADHIEERHSEPPFDYRIARQNVYPTLGDMIDAVCKAYEGDDAELRALLAKRNIIKQTIKKTEDAD